MCDGLRTLVSYNKPASAERFSFQPVTTLAYFGPAAYGYYQTLFPQRLILRAQIKRYLNRIKLYARKVRHYMSKSTYSFHFSIFHSSICSDGSKRKPLSKRHFVRAIAVSRPVTPLPPAPTIPHGKPPSAYKK